MPKQDSTIKIIGTIDNITYYRQNGKYLCRKKSVPISNDAWHTDPSYEAQRRHYFQFKLAIAFASCIYRQLPQPYREQRNWRRLIKDVITLIKKGETADNIIRSCLWNLDPADAAAPLWKCPELGSNILKAAGEKKITPELIAAASYDHEMVKEYIFRHHYPNVGARWKRVKSADPILQAASNVSSGQNSTGQQALVTSDALSTLKELLATLSQFHDLKASATKAIIREALSIVDSLGTSEKDFNVS